MPRGTCLTAREQGQIDLLHQQNNSNREIARQLKRSPKVINNYLSAPSKYNRIKRTGREKKLSVRIRDKIARVASNKNTSTTKIINDLCLQISRWTVNRVLSDTQYLKFKKKKSSKI